MSEVGPRLGDFCVPWEESADDGCSSFYYQSRQFQNRLRMCASCIVRVQLVVISCQIDSAVSRVVKNVRLYLRGIY